jgi:hypothetical protein
VVFVGLLVAAPATAQPTEWTGTVSGTIVDRDANPMPNVRVVASSPALYGEQATVSDEQGHYVLADLPPGTYVLRFAPVDVAPEEVIAIRYDVNVQIGTVTRLDIKPPPVPAPVPPEPVIGPGMVTDEYIRNIPVGRTFGGVLTAGSASETLETPAIVFVDAASPRSRAGEIAVTARVGVGVRRFADAMRCAGVCSGRAPAAFDLEAAYAVTRHVDITVEARFGVERDLDGERAIRISPGVRFFVGDHVFVQPAVSVDVAHELAVKSLEGVVVELGGGFAAQPYIAEAVEVSERLVASFEAGVGLQVHFR